MSRYVSIGHRLTGWNAVKSRSEQLGLPLTDDEIKACTAKIKQLADVSRNSREKSLRISPVEPLGSSLFPLLISPLHFFPFLLHTQVREQTIDDVDQILRDHVRSIHGDSHPALTAPPTDAPAPVVEA